MRNKDVSVSGQPIISKDSTGNLSGVGAHVNVSSPSGSFSGGGHTSKQSTSFWASGEKAVGKSTYIGVSAEASTDGYRHAGASYKVKF